MWYDQNFSSNFILCVDCTHNLYQSYRSWRKNVDTATKNSIEMLKARALHRFHVDREQISEVKPIQIAGAGEKPIGIGIGENKRFKIFKLMSKLLQTTLLRDIVWKGMACLDIF